MYKGESIENISISSWDSPRSNEVVELHGTTEVKQSVIPRENYQVNAAMNRNADKVSINSWNSSESNAEIKNAEVKNMAALKIDRKPSVPVVIPTASSDISVSSWDSDVYRKTSGDVQCKVTPGDKISRSSWDSDMLVRDTRVMDNSNKLLQSIKSFNSELNQNNMSIRSFSSSDSLKSCEEDDTAKHSVQVAMMNDSISDPCKIMRGTLCNRLECGDASVPEKVEKVSNTSLYSVNSSESSGRGQPNAVTRTVVAAIDGPCDTFNTIRNTKPNRFECHEAWGYDNVTETTQNVIIASHSITDPTVMHESAESASMPDEQEQYQSAVATINISSETVPVRIRHYSNDDDKTTSADDVTPRLAAAEHVRQATGGVWADSAGERKTPNQCPQQPYDISQFELDKDERQLTESNPLMLNIPPLFQAFQFQSYANHGTLYASTTDNVSEPVACCSQLQNIELQELTYMRAPYTAKDYWTAFWDEVRRTKSDLKQFTAKLRHKESANQDRQEVGMMKDFEDIANVNERSSGIRVGYQRRNDHVKGVFTRRTAYEVRSRKLHDLMCCCSHVPEDSETDEDY